MEVWVAVQGSGMSPSQVLQLFSIAHSARADIQQSLSSCACVLSSECLKYFPSHPSPPLAIIMVHAMWHLRCLVFLCTKTPILDILIKDLWYNTPVFIVNSKWLGCLVGHEVEMHPLQPGGPRKVLVCKDYLKVTIWSCPCSNLIHNWS